MKNVFEVLKEAESFLSSAGVGGAKASAEVLLSAVMKIPRAKLPLMRDKQLTEEENNQFNSFIARRAKREPVAYILGSCEFMGFEFAVNKNVLIPRPETELLVEEVLRHCERSRCCHPVGKRDPRLIKMDSDMELLSCLSAEHRNDKWSVLDLCTGSGCIAVSFAKLGKFEKITASDISEEALSLAKQNADLNDVKNVKFVLSDMFENLSGNKFDIIVSNPPYVSSAEYENLEPELVKYEPKIALETKDAGLFFYKQIAQNAVKFLNDNGFVFVELNANKSKQIKEIFKDFKDVEIIKDYSGLDRILKASICHPVEKRDPF